MFGRLKDFATSSWGRSGRLRRSAAQRLARAGAAIAGEFGRDELYFYGGLVLIAVGCWDLWRPGAFLFPGAVFVWVSLPMRAGFIDRSQKG